MFNPLLQSVTELTDPQLQERIRDVTRKYFLTSDQMIKDQLSDMLDLLVSEQNGRMSEAVDNNEFDNLISVN